MAHSVGHLSGVNKAQNQHGSLPSNQWEEKPRLVKAPYDGAFSLHDTLRSGQIFHWDEVTVDGFNGYAGCIGERGPFFLAQTDDGTLHTLADDAPDVQRYFGLDVSLSEIHASFPQNDTVLSEAILFCPGIRITRQPIWECLATFITSSMKQVAHIRSMSLTIRERFGTRYEFAGRSFYSYPPAQVLAETGEEALRACSLGYRAKALHRAACDVASGKIDLSMIENELSTDEARAELTKLYGVGDKIANCALLFGAGRWDAFPIDVWMERILRDRYCKRLKGPKLQTWAVRHFGPCCGYAQQYLFHFARKTL